MAGNPFVQPFAKGEWGEGEDPEQTDRAVGASPQAGAAVAGGDAAAAAESWRAEVKQPLVPDSRGQPVTKATASAVGHPPLNQNLSTKEVTEGSLVSSTGFEEYSPEVGAARQVPSFESHCMISSDSGIEMTTGDSIDLAKTLVEPIGSQKAEDQNYIDMCRSGESKTQELSKTDWEEKMMSFVDNTSADTEVSPENLKKSVEEIKLIEEMSPCLSPEEPTTAPYVEEPSDEDISEKWELEDIQHNIHTMDTCASPTHVYLTEIETIVDPNSRCKSQHEQETKPKQGSDVVPTVTVSEPDDDSPISQTPTPSSSEESDSQIEAAYHFLEEERPAAEKTSEQTQCFSLNATEEERSPSAALTKIDESEQNLPKLPATILDLDASSAESGDSEIEVVPDELLSVEEVEGCSYMTFRQVGGTPPSSVSSVQYSILREEREAELDSELIIDPYDASSASEESFQREQESPMKSNSIGRESDEKALMDSQQELDLQSSRSTEYPSSYSVKGTKGTDAATAEPPTPLNYSEAFITPEVVVEEPSPEEASEETAGKISDSKSSDGAKTGKDLGSSQPISSERFLLILNKKTVIDLLYWHDIKQTGIVFGSVLLLLFSLTQFSVVSVIAYLALAALSATISFRIYKSVLQAVQKTDEGHPFKSYLDMDATLSEEQIQKYADSALVYVNSTVKELRRLFLVQDLVDSLKFAVLMWLLTYVGAIFNGLTLMIMAVVSMFTLPVVYEKYQAQIDQYLGLVRTHVNSVVAKIQAKIPGAKRKTE
ncbi:reticulon-1a isoform X1 [Carcharodon carcharias]|uniref:reticulon-1a isoform X1 n=2 Tax=Carcharodon carcharias TaxID=13397 RepID=UPI001B7F7484|nr:reticulon-1a isoform X1 [Carcharodon carcharias]